MFLDRRSKALLLGRRPPTTKLAWSVLGSNAATAVTVPIAIAPAAGALLICDIFNRRNSGAAGPHTCVDSASNVWTQISDSAAFSTLGLRVTRWWLRASGSPGTPTVTVGSATASTLGGVVTQVLNASSDVSNVSPAAGFPTGGIAVAALAAHPRPGSLVLAGFGVMGSGTVYPDPGYTELQLNSPSGMRGDVGCAVTTAPLASWLGVGGTEACLNLLEVKEA